MILLTSPSDQIDLQSGGTVSIKVHVSYVDVAGSPAAASVGRKNTAINSATTTPIVTSPPVGTSRNVKFVSVQNTDPAVSEAIEILHTDGTTIVPLQTLTLPAGWTLTYNDLNGWSLFNASGSRNGPA